MKAKVRLFARLADLAGTRETELELGEGLSVAEAFRVLCQRFPEMADHAGSLMYAVNAEYVSPDHPLRAGDELAPIPPASGGGLGGLDRKRTRLNSPHRSLSYAPLLF